MHTGSNQKNQRCTGHTAEQPIHPASNSCRIFEAACSTMRDALTQWRRDLNREIKQQYMERSVTFLMQAATPHLVLEKSNSNNNHPQKGGLCPCCGSNDLQENGKNYPVSKCKACNWWGDRIETKKQETKKEKP